MFFVIILVSLLLGFKETRTIHVEKGTKKINGVDLYYKVVGEGKPIVILHGGPGLDHTYLLPQMGKLADNFKMIFYDQRASGGSSGNANSSSITLNNFVMDLEGIRKEFNLDKMNLMGHSWGGLLAMFYAIRYPDNLNSLILISTAAASSDFWKPFSSNVKRNRTPEDDLALVKLTASEDFKNKRAEVVQKYLKVFFRVYFYNQSLGDDLNTQINKITAMNMDTINSLMIRNYLSNYNIHEELSAINCPTLVLHGDSDPIPSEFAKKIHERIRNSKFILLKDCGHFPYVEAQKEFFDIMKDFLNELAN